MPSVASHGGIPLIGPILNKIIGTRNERFVKRYVSRADAINSFEPEIRALTDSQIRAKHKEFRERLDKGERAGDLLVEAFAVAREAMDRAVGIRNIFNPAKGFDPGVLPANVQSLYAATRAAMEAAPIMMPVTAIGQPTPDAMAGAAAAEAFRGFAAAVPGWMYVEIPNEIYEAVRALYPESRPPFRARPFDVQLIGAMVLYQGKIAEMKTGEGKTIVAPLACYLAAVESMKVHVVTVNDYLVQRDRDWTAPYFLALGLTVGAIHPQHTQPEHIKREMYQCDVVYGTTSEFGFDYLRDNMKRSVEQQVQKARQFAIVDEVDCILIDEARTPLIISGAAHDDAPRYDLADKLARALVQKQIPWQELDDKATACKKRIKGLEGDMRNARDKTKIPDLQRQLDEAKAELPRIERERDRHTQYFEIEMERKQAHLTHQGVTEAQRVAGIGSFYVGQNMDLPHLLEQSLRAHVVYQLDRDYIVAPTENPHTGRTEPSIVIVDTFTGRPMIGRQWSDGLHQACEFKEGVPIRQETMTVATVTIQNFFKMYKRLAGMTGTADTEAQEFHDIYQLDVVSIPTNRAVVRRDYDDLMFLVQKDKWEHIVDEIKAFHDAGRPILVGTTSVEKSEMLSKMLTSKHQIKHEVLNAKQHEREAHIVENAGRLGAVMIATNMAGRGTDIKLGAVSREALLDHWLRRGIASRTLAVEASTEVLRENIYRKIAPQVLGIPKRDADERAFKDLELDLLRHWAVKHTWVAEKKIHAMDAESLREELDTTGRCLLHRVDWFDNIESMGGLHVMGTERHESRRIDNQLRGRSGRQGDRGSSRFFVSLEDDLMKLFAGETTMKILSRLGMKEGDAIENSMLSKSIERAQRKVEEMNFQRRKTILEYDEVREHQRQAFYGMRQRVLEGRDVRGLIFDFLSEATADSVREYLKPGFAAQCASEHANGLLGTTIAPDRLQSRDYSELAARVRSDAKDEYRHSIATHIGEYLPSTTGEHEIDLDLAGLAEWSKSKFEFDLEATGLLKHRDDVPLDRRAIEDAVSEAALARIDRLDLSSLEPFTEKGYGFSVLVKWAKSTFDVEIDAAACEKAFAEGGAERVQPLIMAKVEEMYRQREIDYPVDFAMDMAMSMARQNPQMAMERLVRWANVRYGLNWTMESLRTTPPQKAREQLLEASRRFVEERRFDAIIAEAVATVDFPTLETYFKSTLQSEAPPTWKHLVGKERKDAITARVENILRFELLYFERTMLLNIVDPAWHDHMYAMERLFDTINYRAFSQQDPRIEFKREGSRLFHDMLENVRDRVANLVFKLKLSPAAQGNAAPPVRQAPRPSPLSGGMLSAPAGAPAMSTISGPGIGGITGPGLDAPVRDSAPAVAESATSGPAVESNGSAKSPRTDRKYARNDACPHGTGRKYKKCCNRPDGTCTGEGRNRADGESAEED